MHLNKQQREELKALSLKVYGVSSKWQKLYETPCMPAGSRVDETATAKRKAFAEKLLAEDGLNGKNLTDETKELANRALVEKVQKPLLRVPTFEELKQALEQMADVKEYSTLPAREIFAKAARQYLDKCLPVRIALYVSDEEQKDFDELLKLLPLEEQEQLKKIVVQKTDTGAATLNGVEFLGELVYLHTERNKAPEDEAP